MKKLLLFACLSVCGFISTNAQTATKLEAESATYENCKLIEDEKYSGGQALELTESNAKITFTYTAAAGGRTPQFHFVRLLGQSKGEFKKAFRQKHFRFGLVFGGG